MKKIWISAILFLLMLSAAAVSAELSPDAQIELIAANKTLWEQDYDYIVWGYVVTDMDHNGRFEIISSSVQGTGFYSYNKAYEVSEDGSRLIDLLSNANEYDSAPDIMVSKVPMYFDKNENRYYYIFSDMIRNGMSEYYENVRAVSIVSEAWEEILLATKATVYSDPEHAVITCKNAEQAEISEAQYASIAETVFGSLESGELCLNWITTDKEAFALLSAEQLMENLRISAQTTCVGN